MSSIAEKLKELSEKIPVYRGYADLEARRESDRELRDAAAAAFSSQVTRITRVQEQAINGGDFDTVDSLDEIINRMQHLVDRLRSASYGYTGLFDEDQVDAEVLDRLYSFDLQITRGVEKVGDLIAQLGGVSVSSEVIGQLRDLLDQLHLNFDRRRELITNPRGSAPESPVRDEPHDPLSALDNDA